MTHEPSVTDVAEELCLRCQRLLDSSLDMAQGERFEGGSDIRHVAVQADDESSVVDCGSVFASNSRDQRRQQVLQKHIRVEFTADRDTVRGHLEDSLGLNCSVPAGSVVVVESASDHEKKVSALYDLRAERSGHGAPISANVKGMELRE